MWTAKKELTIVVYFCNIRSYNAGLWDAASCKTKISMDEDRNIFNMYTKLNKSVLKFLSYSHTFFFPTFTLLLHLSPQP